jgi:hypothetical protein
MLDLGLLQWHWSLVYGPPSSKYWALPHLTQLLLHGPVEFHAFSKWNQRQTVCRYSGSPKKDCKTHFSAYTLHTQRDWDHVIVKKDGPNQLAVKSLPELQSL